MSLEENQSADSGSTGTEAAATEGAIPAPGNDGFREERSVDEPAAFGGDRAFGAGEGAGGDATGMSLPLAVPLEVTAPASTLTIREARADGSADAEPPSSSAAPSSTAPSARPTFVFLGVVSAVTLFLDIGSKAWAEVVMNRRGFEPIDLIGDNLAVTLAYNRGGAWGMFQDAGEMIRKPFFICVSLAAIWFIVSLYARLHTSQKALTWGLPLVLGGALGNLSDRITRSQVIDFIDFRADWVMSLNSWIRQYVDGWTLTDHWPTFNVADIAICIGVGLMAVDMFTSRKRAKVEARPSDAPGDPGAVSASV